MLGVNDPPASAGALRDSGPIPGGGHSNPLQYSCLENPVDRGAWWGPWGHKESDMAEVS